MFKKVIHFSTSSTTKKGLKISIIKIFKNSILIIVENIEYKNFRIKPIKKELLLSIYHYIYQIR